MHTSGLCFGALLKAVSGSEDDGLVHGPVVLKYTLTQAQNSLGAATVKGSPPIERRANEHGGIRRCRIGREQRTKYRCCYIVIVYLSRLKSRRGYASDLGISN